MGGVNAAIEVGNLKLHTVLTDVTGQTGFRIVRSILAGERDPERLAAHRDYRCHASHAEIVAAFARWGPSIVGPRARASNIFTAL